MSSYSVGEEFAVLKDFTLSLPENFDGIGETMYNSRNVIKKVDSACGPLVIKDFKGMYFFNRLGYSFFRKSKAERSYLHSRILNSHGIMTPPPVAWLDCYKWGFLSESYFISLYYPYETLSNILSQKLNDDEYKVSLYHQLAAFTKKLHDNGIYHDDYSGGNILVVPSDDSLQFALVDLNRIKFRKVSYKSGLRGFSKLDISQADTNLLIHAYALLWNQSGEKACSMFWKYKKRIYSIRNSRRAIRRYTLTPLENVAAYISNRLQQAFKGGK
jgi:serine/threonine protein kinase